MLYRLHMKAVSSLFKLANMTTLHQSAKDGFKNGSHYDQYRPSYPTEMVKHLVNSLHASSSTAIEYNVLELGAGTGLFTRKALSILPKDTKYLATDPSADFLSVLQAQSPDLETKIMFASNIPLPDASVENIVCAQCFHWFATEENLTEMTRVLVPHGRILLIFNNKNVNRPWLQKLEDILTGYYGDTPRKILGNWKTAMENFPNVKTVDHRFMGVTPVIKGSKDFIINHFKSVSVIAKLDAELKSQAEAKFRQALDEHFKDDENVPLDIESEFYCVEKVTKT